MKPLRFGRQFQLIEDLTVEMIDNGVPLDNITYSTVITCAKMSNLFDKAVEWFEKLYKTGLMPNEPVSYPYPYNVTMKPLRFGRQFQLIEDLTVEMIDNGVPLDNITYSTVITCAKRSNLFDKAVEWFEKLYKTGLMPDEVTYSNVLDAMQN
ncbi:hypothetical protein L1987_59175 [Smallanthus sonchifolius]|uniref:Uncharacterized protein n=1 Tax=Smallanthus sonchifolius TaxID=185202 RepID=A0ACB9D4U6_9ASTR|nr:hypothetical protein L1987_59175 [Smallanthus sonchifolius]